MRLWRQRTLSSAVVSLGTEPLPARLALCCHSAQAASHARLTGFRAQRPAADVSLLPVWPPPAHRYRP